MDYLHGLWLLYRLGQNDLPYKYTQPSQHWKEATYDPDTYVDPYKQYKENK